jgi:hypothetical protein
VSHLRGRALAQRLRLVFRRAHEKHESGRWDEYDGGIFWHYSEATDLECAIGDTVPFREYSYRQIPYADFEAICIKGDTAKESEYCARYGIPAKEHIRKKRTFDVTITETLKRTVQVRANSEDEAQAIVEDGWKYETHVLGSEDLNLKFPADYSQVS